MATGVFSWCIKGATRHVKKVHQKIKQRICQRNCPDEKEENYGYLLTRHLSDHWNVLYTLDLQYLVLVHVLEG